MNLSVLTTTGAAAGGNMSSMLIMLLVYGAIIAAMDETDSVIIETGSDRARLRIKRWAIGSVDTIHEEDA